MRSSDVRATTAGVLFIAATATSQYRRKSHSAGTPTTTA
jgi:hypothetical protein